MKDTLEMLGTKEQSSLNYIEMSGGTKIFIEPPIQLKDGFRYKIEISEDTIKVWECICYQPMKFEQSQ